MALFSGLNRAHGTYTITGTSEKGKKSGKAITVHEQVTIEKWERHLQGKQGIGIVPIRDDTTVMWGAIDIDIYAGFDHLALENKIHQLALPAAVMRTKSGGAHVYFFAVEPISAKLMRSRLMEFAVALGHPGVEVFPKQVALANDKDFGNWINMPYFDGDRTTRYCFRDGKSLSMAEFLDYAEGLKISADELNSIIVQIGDGEFDDGPPCLQQLAQCGVPPGNRNNALMNFGVFARLKYEDDWEQELERMNHQYVTPPLPAREVMTLVKSLGRKSYFYMCNQAPLSSCCNKEVCKTRRFGIGQNDEPDVLINGLIKIKSEKPIWIMDVEGVRIELETEDFLSQERFRKKCMEKLNRLPRRMKTADWEKLIDALLKRVEEVDAPTDAGPEGQFWHYLEMFCTSRVQARAKEEILMGKPWPDEEHGRVYFRGPDLMKFLEQQKFRELTERQIWAIMRRMNGDHQQMRLKGKTITVWSVPLFDQQTEDFEVRRVQDEPPF